jgi:hypothetical protein
MALGFIRYVNKKSGEFALHYRSLRVGEKIKNQIIYLGKVIDKEKGIYFSREKGTFTYSIDTGFSNSNKYYTKNINKLIDDYEISFGSAWLLNKVLKSIGSLPMLLNLLPKDADTLMFLIFFRLLDRGYANKFAEEWWNSSYAKILYPKVTLKSQHISEFLVKTGHNSIFF